MKSPKEFAKGTEDGTETWVMVAARDAEWRAAVKKMIEGYQYHFSNVENMKRVLNEKLLQEPAPPKPDVPAWCFSAQKNIVHTSDEAERARIVYDEFLAAQPSPPIRKNDLLGNEWRRRDFSRDVLPGRALDKRGVSHAHLRGKGTWLPPWENSKIGKLVPIRKGDLDLEQPTNEHLRRKGRPDAQSRSTDGNYGKCHSFRHLRKQAL